jgi:hypothetical protein
MNEQKARLRHHCIITGGPLTSSLQRHRRSTSRDLSQPNLHQRVLRPSTAPHPAPNSARLHHQYTVQYTLAAGLP